MKKLLTILSIAGLCVACSSSDSDSDSTAVSCSNPAASFDSTSSTATYCVTFTAQWDGDFGTVPGNAHFTTLAGSAVLEESALWNSGSLASAGMESLAETGSTSAFVSEINAEVGANRASGAVTAAGTGATGSSQFTVELNDVYSLFTFATMVAPSPDWFVGLSEYPLRVGGEWVADSGDIDLPVYDAGTEEGTGFSLNNAATDPHEAIARLTETVTGGIEFVDGAVSGSYMAKVRIVRIK